MRIVCQSLADFVTHLKAAGNQVHRNTIYVDRVRNPLNGKNPRDCTAWEIQFSANCIILSADGLEALLCVVEYCGVDRDSEPVTNEGTFVFQSLMKELTAACASPRLALSILPGCLEM